MTPSIRVQIDTAGPLVTIGGLAIPSAPECAAIHAALGPPSRVESIGGRAPPGHRNTHAHIYDDLGISFGEHHFTYRIISLTLLVAHDAPREHSPRELFAAPIWIDGSPVSLALSEAAFVKQSPLRMTNMIGGLWNWRLGGYYLSADCMGVKLPTGRRSRQRRVVEFAICWPYDDWDMSARPPDAKLPPNWKGRIQRRD